MRLWAPSLLWVSKKYISTEIYTWYEDCRVGKLPLKYFCLKYYIGLLFEKWVILVLMFVQCLKTALSFFYFLLTSIELELSKFCLLNFIFHVLCLVYKVQKLASDYQYKQSCPRALVLYIFFFALSEGVWCTYSAQTQ